jgi:hypothetical protein
MATTKKFRVKHGLDASNNSIVYVGTPTNTTDAATKGYVDTQISGLDLSGDVSNTYLTSTYTTNSAFQSYVANTNPRFDSYLQVSNVASYGYVVQSDIDVAIANLVNGRACAT